MKQQLAAALNRELSRRQWSARRLALASGLAPDLVQAYCRGKYEPSLSNALALCRGLGWSIQRLCAAINKESES